MHGKIVSLDKLQEIIGPRPRDRKVIMCHGVFDIVHPGHIHHLLYSKSKADVLVASVTADEHIKKGIYRPHVPEKLRAQNLAVLEMVDYVIVDPNSSPVENIKTIQPDYYAKGYEYDPSIRGRDMSEKQAVESYGGQVIYTPGDVIYSSSALLDAVAPDLRYPKLQTVMESAQVDWFELDRTLSAMKNKRVLVVGDTIVDSFTHCSMIGGQTKTPTISARFEKRVDYVGGAGIVAKHLAAAGAQVIFTTVLGSRDPLSEFVVNDLEDSGVTVEAVFEDRPTVHKNAITIAGYRIVKVDTLDNRSISDRSLEQILKRLAESVADAVVFADFRHGMFNSRTIPRLTTMAQRPWLKVADSQVASRWGNITDFKDFDLITPNEREARFSLGDQDSGIRPLASALFEAARCKVLMLKLGAQGVLTCVQGEFFNLDSFVNQVVDPVGAGDALLAYATLSLLANKSPVVATILGTMAAAIECEVDGNIPVTIEQVRHKLDKVKEVI